MLWITQFDTTTSKAASRNGSARASPVSTLVFVAYILTPRVLKRSFRRVIGLIFNPP